MPSEADSDQAGTAQSGRSLPLPAKRPPKELPPYHVLLLNDDDHSYEYVIHMLNTLFGHSIERAYQLARQVDREGRAIVMTTHKELAELKCLQILAFGIDVRVATCAGSMSATIEPAG